MPRRAFIIGGTGQIGRAVASELLGSGWDVTLSSRGMRPGPSDMTAHGAKIVRLDRQEPGSLAKALKDGADAVIDTVAYDQADADQLLDIKGDVGAFLVISSASVYCDYAGRSLDEAAVTGFPDFPEPIKETQLTVDPGPQTYSTRKVALERRLLDRARGPVVILRPCAIHGPHSTHPREWWFVKRMLDRRPFIPLVHQGESRFHTTSAVSIGKLVSVALDRPKTNILNIADPGAPTVTEIGHAIASHLGYDGRILPIDRIGDSFVGWSPWSVPAPFILDITAANALGYHAGAEYRDCVASTCDWLVREMYSDWKEQFPILAAYPRELFDYEGEDAFFEANDALGHK